MGNVKFVVGENEFVREVFNAVNVIEVEGSGGNVIAEKDGACGNVIEVEDNGGNELVMNDV
ncbi:MAG: hypothetical protein ACHQAX_01425 [Gammaproteobacteria bacterium]